MMDNFTDRLNGYLRKYFIPEILSDELIAASKAKESDTLPNDITDISKSTSE